MFFNLLKMDTGIVGKLSLFLAVEILPSPTPLPMHLHMTEVKITTVEAEPEPQSSKTRAALPPTGGPEAMLTEQAWKTTAVAE